MPAGHAHALTDAVSLQVPAESLSALLSSLLGNAAAWEARDADTLQSLCQLVESGLVRCSLPILALWIIACAAELLI